MCAIRRSHKGYVKSSNYIEVRVKEDASYDEVCRASKVALDLEGPDEEDECLTVFRANGTIVLDSCYFGGYMYRSGT